MRNLWLVLVCLWYWSSLDSFDGSTRQPSKPVIYAVDMYFLYAFVMLSTSILLSINLSRLVGIHRGISQIKNFLFLELAANNCRSNTVKAFILKFWVGYTNLVLHSVLLLRAIYSVKLTTIMTFLGASQFTEPYLWCPLYHQFHEYSKTT